VENSNHIGKTIMIKLAIICDKCGTMKGDTNHWWSIIVVDGLFSARQFSLESDSSNENIKHTCGSACSQYYFDMYLTYGQLELPAPGHLPSSPEIEKLKEVYHLSRQDSDFPF
jgi:hypothetical protein